MALDQGTTSSRCILFDRGGNIRAMSQKEFPQYYPRPGWVEQDPMDILNSQLAVARRAMEMIGARTEDIAAIGITNQRETAIVWEKATGKPVYNAIVWQCRRTAGMIDKLKADGLEETVRETTGLMPDAYFSGSKVAWMLDNVPGARERAERGELLFGTVDSWLIWNMTGGQVHATDRTNASRTMLYDIRNLCWSRELLDYFGIPDPMLPEVKPSSHIYGYTRQNLFGDSLPIASAAGDQQAALFGQCCFEPGDMKNTYGTGCFLLMNTGERLVRSGQGLVTTIAAGTGEVRYALEGSVFVAGAAIQWLRDELHLISTAAQSEDCCRAVSDTAGVYVVPAFAGLGAPHWNQYARGTIVGLTRGATREHIVRATVESMAYQVADIVKAMALDAGLPIKSLRVDGGASVNDFLMQFQADILDMSIIRPGCVETTAMGAAYLAGLAVGFWRSLEGLSRLRRDGTVFESGMDPGSRERLMRGWRRAVDTALSWHSDQI